MWIYDMKIRKVIYDTDGISIVIFSDTLSKPKDIFKFYYPKTKKHHYFQINKSEAVADTMLLAH